VWSAKDTPCERSELLNDVSTATVLWGELSNYAANGALISLRLITRRRRAKRAVENLQNEFHKLSLKGFEKYPQRISQRRREMILKNAAERHKMGS
jgi:hypothetical protein